MQKRSGKMRSKSDLHDDSSSSPSDSFLKSKQRSKSDLHDSLSSPNDSYKIKHSGKQRSQSDLVDAYDFCRTLSSERLRIPNEGEYNGETMNGIRHGEGRFEDLLGNVYNGSWKLDKTSGYGTKVSISGAKYEGNHVEGKRHGAGRYLFSNGDIYSGMWREGIMHGKGKMVWKDGSTFCGQWKQGKMDGHGIKSDSLSVVKGKFRNGKVHGWANKVFFGGGTQGGHDSHEGNYCEDLRKGYGTYLFDDLGGVTRGGFLRGQFQNDNGVLHGNGEEFVKPPSSAFERLQLLASGTSASAVCYYRGSYRCGVRHGKGIAVLYDQSRYLGDWENGEMHGYGRVDYSCGSYYDGEFRHGRREGLGILVYPHTSSQPLVPAIPDLIDVGRSHSNVDDLIDEMIPEPEQRSQSSRSSSSSSSASGFSFSGTGSFQIDAAVAAGFDPNNVDIDDDDDDDDDDDGNDSFSYWDNNKPFHVIDCLGRFRNIRRSQATLAAAINAGLNDCCSYRGQFENDVPHGRGIIELRNGRIWEGDCEEGVAQVQT